MHWLFLLQAIDALKIQAQIEMDKRLAEKGLQSDAGKGGAAAMTGN